MSREYAASYAASQSDPDGFWLNAARALDWERAPTQGWSRQEGWFADGILNTCHNAIDRHVEAGRGEQTAVIYESPVTGQTRHFSYAELRDEVARVAGMLAGLGVAKGDRVVIYMPMIPETLFAMLACARIGAVHSVVFGGFAAPELAKRIDDAKPKLLLTASCGIEGQKVIPYKPLVDHALELTTHSIDHVVLLQRPQLAAEMTAGRDLDWQTELAKAQPTPCVPVASTDPLYILYTSGTTGTPKGVVRDNGGHAVALAWSMKHIYGIGAGRYVLGGIRCRLGRGPQLYRLWAADRGLRRRCCSRASRSAHLIPAHSGARSTHGVESFFTAPTAIRAIRKEDPHARS
jgi:propionyl-CoA synthetase